MATTTKKATTKKATAKKATARKSPSTKKATSRATNTTPLLEREPRTLASDASYAAAGLAVETVTLGKAAVAKIDELRAEVAKAASDPKGTVTRVGDEAPAAVKGRVDAVRHKLIVELESAVGAFERTFDARATEGRKLIDDLKKDARINKLLDQTATTRSQLKGAFTSVTKSAETAVDAGRKQADTAQRQVKGAVTSVTKGVDNALPQVKGAVTSVQKTVDVAVEAGREQAGNAVNQVKAAATSVRKTAESVPDAAEAVAEDVDQAS